MTNRRRMLEEKGQTFVVMAIAMPVLLIALFAMIQFGIVFKNYLALTDAVRVGARQGAVSREQSCPRCVTEAAVRAAATDLDPDDLAVTATSAWTAGSDVTVQATYPYEFNIMGVVVASGNLSSQTVERVN
jgi:Flp pilus assembly protein TadG